MHRFWIKIAPFAMKNIASAYYFVLKISASGSISSIYRYCTDWSTKSSLYIYGLAIIALNTLFLTIIWWKIWIQTNFRRVGDIIFSNHFSSYCYAWVLWIVIKYWTTFLCYYIGSFKFIMVVLAVSSVSWTILSFYFNRMIKSAIVPNSSALINMPENIIRDAAIRELRALAPI